MQLLRSEIHPAVRRTDPTPRQSALLEADQLHRPYDNGGVRIAGRLARERLENREPGDDRRSGTTRTRTGATVERIEVSPAPLRGSLAKPARTVRLRIAQPVRGI